MFDELTTTWETALQVAVATVAVYVGFVLLVRLAGQRSLATLSVADLGCVIALGAIAGRTTLLTNPTLVTGLLALAILVVLRWLTSLAQRRPVARWLRGTPVLLVADGELIPDGLRRAGVADDELRQQLRLAGVTALGQVRYAALETTGEISVLRGDVPVDPWLTEDFRAGTSGTP